MSTYVRFLWRTHEGLRTPDPIPLSDVVPSVRGRLWEQKEIILYGEGHRSRLKVHTCVCVKFSVGLVE